jgi:hypothetical protein
MLNKKAQTGSTLTWFVGFLVIIFIMFLFIAMSFAGTVVQRMSSGKSEIKHGEIGPSFNKSQQQRQMFVLFENEFGGKENYKIIEAYINEWEFDEYHRHLIGSLNHRHLRNKNHFKELNLTIYRYLDQEINCGTFSILDIRHLSGAGSTGFRFRLFRYYHFDMENFNLGLTAPLNKDFSKSDAEMARTKYKENKFLFYFPEKPFALIKYIQTKCPEKKENG